MKKSQSDGNPLFIQRQGQNKELIIKKCISVIEQLQLELERINKINQEQKHLIQILKEGKEYYQNQCKLNSFQQQYIEINRQNQQIKMFIELHKKTQDSLKQKLIKIQSQKQSLLTAIKQKDLKIVQQEQKYLKLRLQKEMVQKEWNKVIKAVKKKINILVAHNESNPEKSAIKQLMSTEQSKKNIQKMIFSSQEKNHFPKEASLQKRALNMMKVIDNMLAAQELQNIFNAETSNKKVEYKYNHISQKKVLRQIDSNRLEAPFNVQFY